VTLSAGGSPEGWVTIALLGKTRGNRGEITAFSFSSKPERFEALKEVSLASADGRSFDKLRVESTWFHQGVLIFKFEGVDTISDAERLAGAEVRVPIEERAPLDAGEFFESDLIGCEVVDGATGATLGRVTALRESGGPGLLEVDHDWLIPFARAICTEIDPARKRIAVQLPPGLRELNP
jgi:16S rRNA processing protein RimM